MRSHQQNDSAGVPEKRSGRPMVLLLFTAAVSFALGMTIGRNTAPLTQEVRVKVPANQSGQDKLSFYKTLPSGETQALGSGINRPAPPPATSGTYTASPPPINTPATKVIVTVPPTVNSSVPPTVNLSAPTQPPTIVEHSPSKTTGSWILQTASYPKESDAQALCKKLRSKGYQVYVESAAIKGKTWYRVFVGPYASSTAAKQAAARLVSQDRLSAIVRKR